MPGKDTEKDIDEGENKPQKTSLLAAGGVVVSGIGIVGVAISGVLTFLGAGNTTAGDVTIAEI